MAILLVILLMMNTIEEEKYDPTDPAGQLAMQYLEKYDNVNCCDLKRRPVSGMESEEDLERSVLKQED